MKTIYIDTDFKCHTSDPDGIYTNLETDFFDGKCDFFIEGYRYIPAGAMWTRSDGVTFSGEMIAPWKDWRALDAAQRAYERQLIAEYEQALSEIEAALGVSG